MLLVSTYEKNSRSFIKPQGGQIFIKKYLEIHNDIEVEIVDPQIDNLEYVKNKFQERYDFFGFYCTYPTVLNTSKLVNEAYKYNPTAVFILGGPGVSYPDIMSICYADIIIYGEGERIISDLVKVVTTKKDLENKEQLIRLIKGDFAVNVFASGKVYYGNNTLGCENICDKDDLNSIIPLVKWEVQLHEKYKLWTSNMLQHNYGFPVYISRGCSSIGCNFCSSYEWFRSRKGVRYCSEGVAFQLICDIFKEMPNTQEILFEDDNLLSNRCWAIKFFDMIKDGISRGEIKQSCKYILKTRVDLIDEEIICKLVKLGDIQINVGVESYTEKVLFELNKTRDAKKYLCLVDRIFEYHKKYNVHFHCYMIFFTPNSKVSDLLATISLVIRFLHAGIEISCYDSLLAFPGSKFDKKWKENKSLVNWLEVKNPLYYAGIYSEKEKERRNITEQVKMPYDFLIEDDQVRDIYDKSSKVFKWLYGYYWNRFNWKANTSFRIALVKVLAYLIVINVNTSNQCIKTETTQQINQLIKLIERVSSERNENMSCNEQVKYFDVRKRGAIK